MSPAGKTQSESACCESRHARNRAVAEAKRARQRYACAPRQFRPYGAAAYHLIVMRAMLL